MQATPSIEQFFRSFESSASSCDTAAQVAHFADVFLAANTQGAQAVRLEDFARALPKRKQLIDGLGCRSTTLVSLQEHRLDARYVLARTRWRMSFVRDQEEARDIEVDSTYIVDTAGDAPKIVFYLASQDLMQVLKDRGIAPA